MWPTHGAGSFCSAPPGAARVTTIGGEKAANPLLAAPDEDAPDGAVVMCGHSERAMTAASLLQRAGHHGLAVLAGGAGNRAATTGRSLQEGT